MPWERRQGLCGTEQAGNGQEPPDSSAQAGLHGTNGFQLLL